MTWLPTLGRRTLCAAVLATLALSLRAADAPDVELAQSAPVETDLAMPDLRFAKDIWVERIDAAKSTIDMGQFYLANEKGQALEPVIAALESAGKRGVKIRLLVSDKMISQDQATFDRMKAIQGAEVKPFDLSTLTKGIIHAKYWVFDKSVVYVGSQNFDWRSLTQIHEMGICVRDERMATQLTSIFESDWRVADSGALPKFAQAAPPKGPPPELELVASPPELTPPDIRFSLDALKGLFASAKKSIRIQVMEYAPISKYDGHWTEIDDALRAAAKRGVKVQLLVSNWNVEKGVIDGLKALSGVANVEVKVITVPLAKQGFIPYARVCHSKYCVFDDEVAWIGTSNWSKSYFVSTRGVEVIVRRKEIASKAAAVFDHLWKDALSEPFDPKKDYPRPRKGE